MIYKVYEIQFPEVTIKEVEVKNDSEVYLFSHWMTPEEMIIYEADNSKINEIISKYI
jgi:hypothetical protein